MEYQNKVADYQRDEATMLKVAKEMKLMIFKVYNRG